MATAKKKTIFSNQLAVCMGISVLAALVLFLISGSTFIQNLELKMLDTLFWLRGPKGGAPEVLVAEVDEKMVQNLGYPVPRKYFAFLINVLQQVGHVAIGFDIFFDMPSPLFSSDSLLCQETHDGKNVRYPAMFKRKDTTNVPDADQIRVIQSLGYDIPIDEAPEPFKHKETKGSVGFPFRKLLVGLDRLCQVNLDPDSDGNNRRVPIFIPYAGKLYPNLGLQLAMDHFGIGPEALSFRKGDLVIKLTNE